MLWDVGGSSWLCVEGDPVEKVWVVAVSWVGVPARGKSVPGRLCGVGGPSTRTLNGEVLPGKLRS